MSGSLKPTVMADLTSEMNEVREKEEMSSRDNEFEEKFNPVIPPAQTQSTVHDIETKQEDLDYHHRISTRESYSDGNSDLENVPNIPHVQGSDSDDPEGKDMNNFYRDLLLCDPDCETCVKYLRMLSKHVRATHTPPQPQPIQDPLFIDPVKIDHDPSLIDNEQSSSIEIKFKCEADEATQKMECSPEASETNIQLSDLQISDHKEFESECESENEIDPDYTPPVSAYLTRSARRRGLTENKVLSDSKISKAKKGSLPSRKLFKCDVCRKILSTKRHLKVHKRTHTGERPYKCAECDNDFTRSDHLTSHMLVHTGEKLFNCGKCAKSFSRSDHLTRHMRSHTGEKPYECTVCEKSFSTSYHLTAHMRIHTGEKPYECTLCEKSFKRSDHLTKHKSTHTGNKPFKCDQCQSYFTTSTHLTEHKRIHTRKKVFK